MENQEVEVIERAIVEAGKMDIPQLRGIVDELANDQAKLDEFKNGPTEYVTARMEYVPLGFHAHYAEGSDFVPAETFGEAKERFAFSLRIGEVGSLSFCVFCAIGCCVERGGMSATA